MNGTVEQSQNVCFAAVAMKDRRVHGVSHKHIRPNAGSDLTLPWRVCSRGGGQIPFLPVKFDLVGALERLLGGTNVVLPFLSEVEPVNYPVDVIVADIRMHLLNKRVHFDSSQGAFRKKEFNRIAEYCVGRCAPRSKLQDLLLCVQQFLSKEATSFFDDLAFGSLVEPAKS